MKIGIVTTFSNLSPEYSLANVVRQQMYMLTKHGYEVVLFTLNIFRDDDKIPEGVELRKIVPQLVLEPYGAMNADSLEPDLAKVIPAFEEHMQDIDIGLTHDIIFINSFLPYNIALRQAMKTKLSHVKWLHWMHSGPSFADLNGDVWDNLRTLPDNSKLVYMNHTDIIRAAEMYHTWPSNVRVVHNPMDIRDLHSFHPLTRELIDAYDLMSADFINVYPLSSTRMNEAGKQLHKVIPIIGNLKKQGFSVRLVVPNAHANAQREKNTIEHNYQLAQANGLERNEVLFTSMHDVPKWEHGVPHEVVRDLFLMSNIFIFPTVSENCPLVLLEAMSSGNILVLNGSFPALKDFGRNDAMYFRFGSLVDEPRFPDGVEKYYEDIAKLIINNYENNGAIKAKTNLRQHFNVDYIFKRQLEPVFKELTHGE